MRVDYKFPKYPRISPECKDLIQRILVGEPERRLSIREIQEHPWCAARQRRRLQRRAAPVLLLHVKCRLRAAEQHRSASITSSHRQNTRMCARRQITCTAQGGCARSVDAAAAAVLGLA